jgi:hypothetical protein
VFLISEFWNSGIPRNSNSKDFKFRNSGNSEFWNSGVPGNSNYKDSEFRNYGNSEFWNFAILEFPGILGPGSDMASQLII